MFSGWLKKVIHPLMALPGGKYLSKRFRIRIFTFRFLIELLRCPHLTQNLENVLHWHPKFLHRPSTDSESLWLFRSACTIARIIIKIGSSISTPRCQRQSPLAMLTWAWTCKISAHYRNRRKKFQYVFVTVIKNENFNLNCRNSFLFATSMPTTVLRPSRIASPTIGTSGVWS